MNDKIQLKLQEYFRIISLIGNSSKLEYNKRIIKVEKWINDNLAIFNDTDYYDFIKKGYTFLNEDYSIKEYYLYKNELLKELTTKYYYVCVHKFADNTQFIEISFQEYIKCSINSRFKENKDVLRHFKTMPILETFYLAEYKTLEDAIILKNQYVQENENIDILNIKYGDNYIISTKKTWEYDYSYQRGGHKKTIYLVVPKAEKQEFETKIKFYRDYMFPFFPLKDDLWLILVVPKNDKMYEVEECLDILKKTIFNDDINITYKYELNEDWDMMYYFDEKKGIKTIYVNLPFLLGSYYDFQYMFFAISHEFRHNMQRAMLVENFLIYEETDKLLFDNTPYVQPSEDEKGYYLHPKEIDANAFAEAVSYALRDSFPKQQYCSRISKYEEYGVLGKYKLLVSEMLKRYFPKVVNDKYI